MFKCNLVLMLIVQNIAVNSAAVSPCCGVDSWIRLTWLSNVHFFSFLILRFTGFLRRQEILKLLLQYFFGSPLGLPGGTAGRQTSEKLSSLYPAITLHHAQRAPPSSAPPAGSVVAPGGQPAGVCSTGVVLRLHAMHMPLFILATHLVWQAQMRRA